MTTAINRPARVGIITDQTGALSFMGSANVSVAKMVIDDINAGGGLLGRPVELFIEDSATDDSVAEAVAARLVEQAAVDVVVGGIYSSTRQAIKRPVVDQAEKLYIYPEQYEGQECHPLIFCTGPVPAQQVEPLEPWRARLSAPFLPNTSRNRSTFSTVVVARIMTVPFPLPPTGSADVGTFSGRAPGAASVDLPISGAPGVGAVSPPRGRRRLCA